MTNRFLARRRASVSRLARFAGPLALMSLVLPSAGRAAEAPASMTLAPASADVGLNATAPFTATLLDASGQPTTVEANSSVGFAVDDSPIADVTIDAANPLVGNVRGKAAGMTTVRAFYVRDGQQTNIFASAMVRVVASCAAGQAACNGKTCMDILHDITNCGACGNVCSGMPCINGACQPFGTGSAGMSGSAPGGSAGGASGGSGGGMSDAGASACATGEAMCTSGCTNLASDPSNCGACGQVCMGTCANAICQKSSGGGGGCRVGGSATVPGLASLAILLGATLLVRRQRRRQPR